MLKHLILTLFSILITSPSPCNAQTQPSPISDSTTGQLLGQIPLYGNFQYYVVYSYLLNSALPINNYTGIPLAYSMILALYTSQTIIASNCSTFNNFSNPCQTFICNNPSQSTQTLPLPYFEAQGITASSQIGWNTSTVFNVPLFVTSSCLIGTHSYYGNHLHGLIGMGTSNKQGVAPISTYFSIYLTQTFLGNSLLLYFDPTKAQSSTPVAVLNSDSDWNVRQIASIQVGNQTMNVSGVVDSLIFDVNSIANYFPQQLYDFILNALKKDFTCYGSENDNLIYSSDTDTYDNSDAPFPICAYSLSNINNLPTITITSGNEQISIPPQIYVGQGYAWSQNITLNIITTQVDNFSRYYVTPEYQDNIILGSTFMTYYYTLFDATNGGNTISLYLANHNAASPSSGSGTNANTETGSTGPNVLGIVFGVLFAILMIVCLVGAYWIWKMRKERTITKKEREISMVTLQVPLAPNTNSGGGFKSMNSSGKSDNSSEGNMNVSGKSGTSEEYMNVSGKSGTSEEHMNVSGKSASSDV